MRNSSMRKFGTPIFAGARASASEYVGSLRAGGGACSGAVGAFGATSCWTFPVSDSVLPPPTAVPASRGALSTPGPRSCRRPSAGALPGRRPGGRSGSAVAVAGGVGAAATAGVAVAVGAGVARRPSRGPRSTTRARAGLGSGPARPACRAARRRDRQLLACHQGHAHVEHRPPARPSEDTGVEGGGGERDGERAAGGHEPAGRAGYRCRPVSGRTSGGLDPPIGRQASVDTGLLQSANGES